MDGTLHRLICAPVHPVIIPVDGIVFVVVTRQGVLRDPGTVVVTVVTHQIKLGGDGISHSLHTFVRVWDVVGVVDEKLEKCTDRVF